MVNATPHTLNVHTEDGVVTLAPSGMICRVETRRVPAGAVMVNGATVTVSTTVTGEVKWTWHGAPCLPPAGDVIVSGQCRAAMLGEPGVYSPGELVRGPDGRPVGCKGLTKA